MNKELQKLRNSCLRKVTTQGTQTAILQYYNSTVDLFFSKWALFLFSTNYPFLTLPLIPISKYRSHS